MQHTTAQSTQPQPPISVLARSNVVVSALVILTLMSGWAMFLYLGIGSLIPSQSRSKSTQETTSKTTITESTTASSRPIVRYEESERAFVLELQRRELLARVEKAKTSLKRARSVSDRFQQRIAAMQIDSTGRRLATPDTARKMRFLFGFPDQTDFTSIERSLSAAEQSIHTTRQPIMNFDQFVEKLVSVESTLASNNRPFATASTAVDQLLDENLTAQPITLKEAIDQIYQFDSVAVAKQVDARIANERSVLAAQTQTEANRRSQFESQLKAAKLRHDAARQQAHAANESFRQSMLQTKQEASARKDEAIARMRAAYPQMQSLLLPFTTPGYRQSPASGRLEVTSEKQPLSYAGLLRTGALDDSDKGLKKLFYMAQSSDAFGKLNDRPQGEFPVYKSEFDIKRADVRSKVKRTQAFLRDHGEAMVAAGLLSP